MAGYWLPGALKLDLSSRKGYGPLRTPKLGGVLHCNQSRGRLEAYVSRPTTEVCPTFQVYEDGPPTQFLPLDWQSVCQSAGNQNYFSIETEGYGVAIAGHPATALNSNQLDWCARIVDAAHAELSMPLKLAEKPGQAGLGWHGMGGNDWGGHPQCPGVERKAQRQVILDMLTKPEVPDMTPEESGWLAYLYKTFAHPELIVPNPIFGAIAGLPTADQIANAVVAKLPASGTGGATPEQVRSIVTEVINNTHLGTS